MLTMILKKYRHTYNCHCKIILDVVAMLSLTVAISNGRVTLSVSVLNTL